MATFTAVDLSKLAAPDLIDAFDFETLFASSLAQFVELLPEFSALTESDPVYKILQLFAARELNLRQQINEKAKQCMLAFAAGSNLDHLGALFGVTRLTLGAGDADNGVDPTMESDTDFRRRIQLAPEGYSVAGPEGAYIYHALSADPDVLDASAMSPTPGEVLVTVLSRTGDGTASPEVIATVDSVLQDEGVRPLTDAVTVQSAQIVPYAVIADIYTYAGPDAEVVMAAARSRLNSYLASSHRLGRDVPESALKAMLFADGVQRVVLHSPAGDVVIGRTQAPYCSSISLNHSGDDE